MSMTTFIKFWLLINLAFIIVKAILDFIGCEYDEFVDEEEVGMIMKIKGMNIGQILLSIYFFPFLIFQIKLFEFFDKKDKKD